MSESTLYTGASLLYSDSVPWFGFFLEPIPRPFEVRKLYRMPYSHEIAYVVEYC